MKDLRQRIIESYVKAYNDFDVETMLLNLTEDVVFENKSNGTVTHKTIGIDEFKKQAITAKDYFEKRTQTIESWEFRDSQIVISIQYQAVLAIDLPNGMKKGQTLNLTGTSTFIFDREKIKKITDES